MKILVTGAKGMLGQDLCPILEDEGFDVVETDVQALDITNLENVETVLTKEKPDWVIHCAAYTNVDGAESDEETAQKINGLGSENIAKVCGKNDIGVVYISTDYVFNGEKDGIYTPEDTPCPINVYGKTKLYGEQAVQKYCKKYYVTRTSWLYGHHGKNFVETMISLADKPELKVVDDQVGSPTWTVELSNAIINLIKEEADYGIYLTCGSGYTSWYGFAKEIFSLIGKNVNLKPCDTDEFPRAAKRPRNSRMDNGNRCKNWKISLKNYIDLRTDD